MLFFLRQIRRKLLMKNKVTTYFLYAIGEITLVVVGILIALQLDNWNESNNNQKKELSYLNSYIYDLNANIRELDRVIDKSGYMHGIADTLIQRFDRGERIAQPELDSLVLELVAYSLYLSKEGTTENLLGAGSLEIIQNLEIRSSFVTQEADQKRLREVEKGVYDVFSEMLIYLKLNVEMYNYQLGKVMVDEQTQSRLMADRYFKNLLDDISFKYKNLQLLYRKRQEELIELLEIVKEEVGRLE